MAVETRLTGGQLLRPPPRKSGRLRKWQVLCGGHVVSKGPRLNQDGTVWYDPNTGKGYDQGEIIYKAGDVFESALPLDEMYNDPHLHPSQQKFREVFDGLPPGFSGSMSGEEIERWREEVKAQWRRESEEEDRERRAALEAEWRYEWEHREEVRQRDVEFGMDPNRVDASGRAVNPPSAMPQGPGGDGKSPAGIATVKKPQEAGGPTLRSSLDQAKFVGVAEYTDKETGERKALVKDISPPQNQPGKKK